MWHNVSLNVSLIIRQGDYTEYNSKEHLTCFKNLCLAFRLVVPCYYGVPPLTFASIDTLITL